MPSHYSTLGFDFTSDEDMTEVMEALREGAVAIETVAGTYHRWTSSSGAELWIQTDRQGELVGAHPHFTSALRTPIRLEAHVTRDDQTVLDGAYSGWVGDSYPIIIDCPNFRQTVGTALPAVAQVQVAAFAHELWAFDSPEQFEAAEAGEVSFASQSFVPASALDDKGAAEAFFCGHVLASGVRTNDFTGYEFYWAEVETLDATYDVVIDPELVAAAPVVGGVIKGTFWLSGYVDSLESRAGMLKKLAWRFRSS
jgi:hypothetical protein